MEKPAVGKHLRRARVQHGLSLRALAKKVHIGHSALYRMESGEANTPVEIAIILAQFYNMPLDQLVGLQPYVEDCKSIVEWGQLLGISRQVLSYHIRGGRLRYVQHQAIYYCTAEDLLQLCHQYKVKPKVEDWEKILMQERRKNSLEEIPESNSQ